MIWKYTSLTDLYDFSALSDYQDRLAYETVPGNDLSVSVGNREVYRHQAGFADVETRRPVDGNETYFAWSASKIVTSVLGMKLVEDGILRLDYPLSFYMPEFADMSVKEKINGREEIVPARSSISVLSLFNMTAGFGSVINVPEIREVRNITDGKCPTSKVISAYSKVPLINHPGEHFSYGLCHDVLAALIERVTGKRFAVYAHEMIFKPLDMKDTSFGITSSIQTEKMATQYLYRDDLCRVVPMKKVNLFILGDEYDSGGAGLVTSCSDFMKLAMLLANGGTSYDGYRLISPETVELYSRDSLNETQRKEFRKAWTDGYSYGLGVETMTDGREYECTDDLRDFGWNGAAGMKVRICTSNKSAFVYTMHLHNMPDNRNVDKKMRNLVFGTLAKK